MLDLLCLVAQSYPTLCDPMDCSQPGSSVHGDSPGRNTGVGCHDLLQGISPIQGSKPGLLHCRRILYYLSQQRSPRILQWVAYPFSRGSSGPCNQNGVSCIALSEVAQLCPTLCKPLDCSLPGFSVHGDFPGKNTGVGCHALVDCSLPGSSVHGSLQAKILEWVAMPSSRGSSHQGLNPGLLHCRRILYYLSHQGSPRILEWVAYSFSRGSFQPRNRTSFSCIAGGFFTS